MKEICDKLEIRLKKDFEATKASGGTAASIRVEWHDGRQGVLVEAVGKKSLLFAENGRRPGKMPPENPILQWIRVKPILSDIDERSLTYLIRRKIAREGTKGKKYIAKVAVEFHDEILKAIAAYRRKELEKKIKEITKKLK